MAKTKIIDLVPYLRRRAGWDPEIIELERRERKRIRRANVKYQRRIRQREAQFAKEIRMDQLRQQRRTFLLIMIVIVFVIISMAIFWIRTALA